MLLRLSGVSRSFGSRELFRDVSLTVSRADRIGLVGPNGAGKTTLLRIVAGLEPPDDGRVEKPRDVRVGFLRQEIDPGREETVFAEVSTALAHLDALERELGELEREIQRCGADGRDVPAELAARYDRCRGSFELQGGFERAARVERVLAGLGFDGEASARRLSTFSGGWLMRVELAKLLLAAPDVLLLDEPTNHLDLPSIQWFEETLAAYPGAVVLISHDRTFLRRQSNRIAELADGRFTLFDVGFDDYLEARELRRAQRLAERAAQDRKVAETERFIERFRYKASKARQVQSRVKSLAKLDRVEVSPENGDGLRLRMPPCTRSGDVVLRLAGIHKRYGEQVVYRGVDLQLRRGDRVALVGPNGAGKSTLLRIAAGVLDFDAGERALGHKVELAFFAQHQLEALDPGRSVLEELETVATIDDHPRLRSHLGAFLFSGDDVDKKVAVLSGGEKSRLALAKLLLHPANFLVLDEPTNHLDVPACEVLEEALGAYDGTLLLISHDRAFLNSLATRVVDVRGGVLDETLGNYDDWVRGRGSAAPAAAAESAPADIESDAKRERIAARQRAKDRARELARARKRAGELEREIAGLEEQLAELVRRSAEPDVYRDGEAARTVAAERAAVNETLEGRYAEWERQVAAVEAAERAAADAAS